MDIVVTVKQVPDPNFPPRVLALDPAGKRIAPPLGIPQVMNGYDANALEAALRLKDSPGGKVTALCVGDDGSRAVLKRAVSMGADAAVLLGDERWLGADSAGIARAIAAAVRRIGRVDLVLCGRQASDTDGGQVHYRVAECLKLPIVSPVSCIEAINGGEIIVQRLVEDVLQRLRIELPAVLGISSEINEPRLPSMRGMAAATRMRIPRWSAADLGLPELASRVEPRRLRLQQPTALAELIGGGSGAEQGAALADRLRDLGLI